MKGYLIPVTCPRCGGELEHVAGATSSGTEARAVAGCASCRRRFRVVVHLRRF